MGRLGLNEVPEYLKEEAGLTISEINVGREMTKVLEEFNTKVDEIAHSRSSKPEVI